MKNSTKSLAWRLNRTFTCLTGFSKVYDDCVKAEIDYLEKLWELLQQNPPDLLQNSFKPQEYPLECPYYLGCSKELSQKYQGLYDKISSFLHSL